MTGFGTSSPDAAPRPTANHEDSRVLEEGAEEEKKEGSVPKEGRQVCGVDEARFSGSGYEPQDFGSTRRRSEVVGLACIACVNLAVSVSVLEVVSVSLVVVLLGVRLRTRRCCRGSGVRLRDRERPRLRVPDIERDLPAELVALAASSAYSAALCHTQRCVNEGEAAFNADHIICCGIKSLTDTKVSVKSLCLQTIAIKGRPATARFENCGTLHHWLKMQLLFALFIFGTSMTTARPNRRTESQISITG
ncbi:hypothetical protein HPB49_008398 [Dermacentor silvarum]|uniref:Uncharacterized protein n=1 Tax=Dermacentor silvarum TaxID=543639 RepID=A0ACB8C2Q1_DERSI|nr:hypothetical protein HPB49_008398 [Dermacentor silvarum]